ncbi:MAG: hypothetical protein LBU32_06240, partial [Clostridiales bacterium]|nr:hypothetical protein [Clostridiales bacterium]
DRQIMKKELNALKKSSLGSLNRERFGICRAYVKGVKLSCKKRPYNIELFPSYVTLIYLSHFASPFFINYITIGED